MYAVRFISKTEIGGWVDHVETGGNELIQVSEVGDILGAQLGVEWLILNGGKIQEGRGECAAQGREVILYAFFGGGPELLGPVVNAQTR